MVNDFAITTAPGGLLRDQADAPPVTNLMAGYTYALAAVGEEGGSAARGGMEGRGLGHRRLARDDDGGLAGGSCARSAAATSPWTSISLSLGSKLVSRALAHAGASIRE